MAKYTVRFEFDDVYIDVNAENPDKAEDIALDILRKDPELLSISYIEVENEEE